MREGEGGGEAMGDEGGAGGGGRQEGDLGQNWSSCEGRLLGQQQEVRTPTWAGHPPAPCSSHTKLS